MKNNIKKYAASAFMVALFGIYAAYRSMPGGTQTAAASVVATAAPVVSAPPVGVPKPAPSAPAATVRTVRKPASRYKDGTYVGSVADAYYGNVQVQVTVSGGVITSAVALQSPDSRSQSLAINGRALPILQSESVSVQSANVNAVSGATYTSAAYRQSLASAIAQAMA